jgi:hypothetical protein
MLLLKDTVRSFLSIKFALYGLLLMSGLGLLAGCQYQFGYGELSQRYTTLSVPYAEGDSKGELTAEVIKKISTSGAFRYVNCQGDLILKIKFIELRDENIGFRYDRKKRGKLRHAIVPTETRLKSVVEAVLTDAAGRVVRGPTRIAASIDFDHSFYSSRHGINIFSLGQLSDIDAAHDAVMHPLNQQLADRIVDYIINSW